MMEIDIEVEENSQHAAYGPVLVWVAGDVKFKLLMNGSYGPSLLYGPRSDPEPTYRATVAPVDLFECAIITYRRLHPIGDIPNDVWKLYETMSGWY